MAAEGRRAAFASDEVGVKNPKLLFVVRVFWLQTHRWVLVLRRRTRKEVSYHFVPVRDLSHVDVHVARPVASNGMGGEM